MTKLNVQTKKNEKGVALIFTLIMLSLLMIMALAFVLDSMFSQKSAYNAASANSARFIAEAQLKQVLALIKKDQMNSAEGYIYSKDIWGNTDVPTQTDMLEEQVPSAVPYSRLRVYGVLDDNNNNGSLIGTPPAVNWNYIRSGPLATDTIIGRTAFVVIPDAKVPLDSLISKSYNEKLNAELRIGKEVSEINVRGAIPAVTTNLDTITDKLNWSVAEGGPGTGIGEYTGTNWTSFPTLFGLIPEIVEQAGFSSNLSLAVSDDKEVFWADANTNTKIDKGELYKRFDLTRDWTTADNTADLVFLRDKILLDAGNTGVPTTPMETWTNTPSDAISKGLPWLACFGYKKDGTPYTIGTSPGELNSTFLTVKAHRYQIAANLKDYCDNDGAIAARPTSDKDPASWTTSADPTFTGNERTPYINKIGFNIKASQNEAQTAVGPPALYTVASSIEISPYVELVNIYDTSWATDLKVYIKGTVTTQSTVDSVPKPLNIHSLDTTITISAATDWTGGEGYSDFSISSLGSSSFNSTPNVGALSRSITVKVTAVNITKVVIYYENAGIKYGYDYTKALSYSANLPYPVFLGDNAGAECSAWFGFAAHDPRQNLNSGDWLELTPAVNDTATEDPSAVFSLIATSLPDSYFGKPNADNSINGGGDNTDAPSAGDDSEIGNDPANKQLSTAFIRNAPMESPWELGFIHRAARWQTINLKTFDPAKAISTFKLTTPDRDYIAGGGLYADGDANILDQIKMTDAAKSPQKINLSASDTIFFDALFDKIRLGCDIVRDTAVPVVPLTHMTVTSMAGYPTAPTNLTTEIAVADPAVAPYSTMRDAIIAWFKTPDLSTFTNITRASIVSISTGLLGADPDGSPTTIDFGALQADTDASQEELIGKIANLTKVGSGTGNFKIIVLAQTIKDIGTAAGISITKASADETTIKTQNCMAGTFDVDVSNVDSKKHVYFDEITSEQKILVSGSWDGTNLKISSFQYVE